MGSSGAGQPLLRTEEPLSFDHGQAPGGGAREDDAVSLVPLRPALAKGHWWEGRGAEGSPFGSIPSAVFNLTNTSVGAGIMALPAAVKILGVPTGLVFIVLLGVLTDLSLRVLMQALSAGQCNSYSQLAGECLGPWGSHAAKFCILAHTLCALIAYLIIIGDVLSGSDYKGVHHSGILEQLAGGPTWWNGRVSVLLALSTSVLLPLASLSRINSLAVSSALAIALAAIFVAFTVFVCGLKWAQGTLEPPRLLPQLSLDLFSCVPVIANAYVCHFNVPPIFQELPHRTHRDISLTAHLSELTVTVIYIAAGLSGYLLFGEATASDVLSNFDADLGVPQLVCGILRFGYVLHLLLVFPVVHFPLRLLVDGLLFPDAALPLSQDRPRFAALTLTLLAVLLFFAILIPDIYTLIAFISPLVAVTIGYTLPALIALRCKESGLSQLETLGSWLLLAFSVLASVTGLLANFRLL